MLQDITFKYNYSLLPKNSRINMTQIHRTNSVLYVKIHSIAYDISPMTISPMDYGNEGQMGRFTHPLITFLIGKWILVKNNFHKIIGHL